MKIIYSLITGLKRTLRAWKGALIITLSLLLVTSFFTLSLKTLLRNGFGSSMAPSEMADNFNFDLIADLFQNIGGVRSIIPSDLFLVFLTGFLLITFFTGGLFDFFRNDRQRFSIARFFNASATFFWPFLGISLMTGLMILFLPLLIMIVVGSIGYMNEQGGGNSIISVVMTGVMAILMILVFLVADFSRAYYVANDSPGIFRSIGFGFKMTFGKFFTSVPLMLILVIINILLLWMMTVLIGRIRPGPGFIVFLMFLLSQILFFIRIISRAWRYAGITSLMEQFLKAEEKISDQPAAIITEPAEPMMI